MECGGGQADHLFNWLVLMKDTVYCFEIPKTVSFKENKAVSHFCHLGWPVTGA